jgi:hypothetical protein
LRKSVIVSAQNAWGSIYSGDTFEEAYPFKFTSDPVVGGFFSTKDTSLDVFWPTGASFSNAKEKCFCRALSDSKKSSKTTYLNVYAFGKWK